MRQPLTYVKRTITTSNCYGQRVNDHGEFEDYNAVLYGGGFTPKQATTTLRQRKGDPSICINNVEEESHLYRIDYEEIVKYGTICD